MKKALQKQVRLTMQTKETNPFALDTSEWKFFLLKDLCVIDMGNKLDFSAMSLDDPTVNFVGRSAANNGVMGKVDAVTELDPYPAGALTVALGGSLGSTYVQVEPFYTSQNVAVLQFDVEQVSIYARLFLANMIYFESQFKYFPFGRELNKYLRRTYGFKLPVKKDVAGHPIIDPDSPYSPEGYIPDWQFMEDFIKGLNHKPLSTNNKAGSALALDESSWKDFEVKDIFDLRYGVNLALNACTETNDGVNFVSRTESNNGVSSRIAPVKDLSPQQAGLITTATGGSVLSTFLQPSPFYSGRDLYVMEPKEKNIGNSAKLFLVTVLEANKFKFNYGRQANKSLPHIKLRLPIKRNSDGTPVIDPKKTFHDDGYIPDWQFMEDYMRSLPYGDRIPEAGEF